MFVLSEYPLCFYTYSHICLITLAGTPATSEWGGTSLVTTAPAATTECCPMLTPGRMVAFAPIQMSSSIVTGAVQSCHCNPLRQIHMTANRYRTDNRIVESHAGMVTDNHIAHRIVDTTERLDDAIVS